MCVTCQLTAGSIAIDRDYNWTHWTDFIHCVGSALFIKLLEELFLGLLLLQGSQGPYDDYVLRRTQGNLSLRVTIAHATTHCYVMSELLPDVPATLFHTYPNYGWDALCIQVKGLAGIYIQILDDVKSRAVRRGEQQGSTSTLHNSRQLLHCGGRLVFQRHHSPE
eukprot:SAG11_NODE_3543_length_2380_cov_1.566857_3_plen_165_part_00